MVGAFYYYTMAYDGGVPHAGDMTGHAARRGMVANLALVGLAGLV